MHQEQIYLKIDDNARIPFLLCKIYDGMQKRLGMRDQGGIGLSDVFGMKYNARLHYVMQPGVAISEEVENGFRPPFSLSGDPGPGGN